MRSCLIVAVVLCYAQSASAHATSVSDDPPSIVIIFTDDQGDGGVSVLGAGVLPVTSNAPGRTRTRDLRFRRPLLYPAELPGLVMPILSTSGSASYWVDPA